MTTLALGFNGGQRGYWPQLVRSDYTFATDTGAQAAYTVFTVTGNVLIHAVFGICAASVTGAGTMALGVSGNTAALIASTTAADLITNEIWHDASPTTTLEKINFTGFSTVISNGQDVQFLIAGANITAGTINFYCIWSPLSANGAVVAA